MTAQIIHLADYRGSRVHARCTVTFDPLAMWREWASFWMGARRCETENIIHPTRWQSKRG